MKKLECITCGIKKDVSNYWRQKSKSSGYFGECKSCAKERNNKWHEKNRGYATAKNTHICRRLRKYRPEKNLYNAAKQNAPKRCLEFSISVDDIKIPEFCPVLGIKLESGSGKGKSNIKEMDKRPSLDRIDNSVGYVPKNIIVVSYRANRLKNDSNPDELQMIADFYRNLK